MKFPDNVKVYMVGGCMRDILLGIEPKDYDYVVVGATPQIMLDLKFKQVGKGFPVFLHPDTGEEYALARTEKKTGHGYNEFECQFGTDITLDMDLARRDFTINAIAKDTETGEMADPFKGIQDIADKTIRAVSEESFVEDPLRVLRAARFTAQLLEFNIDSNTLHLMKVISESGELSYLTPERIWLEMVKTLKTDHPARYFEVLVECNALSHVFPELDKLRGVPQPKMFHAYDAYEHSLISFMVSCTMSTDPRVRFAALTHDLGKGLTPKEDYPSHHNHDLLGEEAVEELCNRLNAPNEYKNLAKICAREHMKFHLLDKITPQSLLKLCKRLDVFHQTKLLEEFIIVCTSDFKGTSLTELDQYVWNMESQVLFLQGVAASLRKVNNMEVIHRARLNAIKRVRRVIKGYEFITE